MHLITRIKSIKAIVIGILIASLLLPLSMNFVEVAYGASGWKYGILVSMPDVIASKSGGKYYITDDSGVKQQIKKGQWVDLDVTTWYSGDVQVTYGKWKNARFRYVKALAGTIVQDDGYTDTDAYLRFRWNGTSDGTGYATEYDWYKIIGDCYPTDGTRGQLEEGAHSYTVRIHCTDYFFDWIDDQLGRKSEKAVGIATGFLYKSVNRLESSGGSFGDGYGPDGPGGGGGGDDGDKEPVDPPEESTVYEEEEAPDLVSNTATISATTIQVNYMNKTGKLSATGNIQANIEINPNVGKTYLDKIETIGNDKIYHYVTYVSDKAWIVSNKWSSFRVFGNDYGDSGNVEEPSKTVTFDLTEAGFNSEVANGWLVKQSNIQYYYETTGTALTELNNHSSAQHRTNGFGYVILQNEKPKASFSLQTLPGDYNNNQTVENGYYYTDVNTEMIFEFSDYENDIRNVYIAWGKKDSMDMNMCEFSYSMSANDGEPTIFSDREDLYEAVSIEPHGLNGVKVTLKFNQPGTYSYMAYVNDANSNQELVQSDMIQGNFIVRGGNGPQAPNAVITSPQYAFEENTLQLAQNSTDPNGADDIRDSKWAADITDDGNFVYTIEDVTEREDPDAAGEGFTPITGITVNTNNTNPAYTRGGTIKFPADSSHHYFEVKLWVKDATGLTDIATQVIKVISDVPVANLAPEGDVNTAQLKENRKITVSALGSIAPVDDPIQWNRTEWTISKVEYTQSESGDMVEVETPITDANELRKILKKDSSNQKVDLQFYEVGQYKVTLKLHNNFSDQNQEHEDIGASTTSMYITVVEDVVPQSSVGAISGDPSFGENPEAAKDHVVTFRVASSSTDGDIINPVTSYSWTLYEDFNNDGAFTEDEKIPDGKLTYNADHTEVSYTVTFYKFNSKHPVQRHNTVKAVVTTTEAFGEPYLQELLNNAFGANSNAWQRSTTVEATEIVNWAPDVEIVPPPSSTDQTKTPYMPWDVDGDTVIDGNFIMAYVDDFVQVGTDILDEFPSTCSVTWELSKKDHDGVFHTTTDSGQSWIQSSYVSHTLGNSGGTIRINSNGVYKLRMIATDDMGSTGEFTLMLRIFPLPIGVLEANPDYLYYVSTGGGLDQWQTKENVRYDIRSNPSIVDDEWGPAWHYMDFSSDDWTVTPLDSQDKSDIHFANWENINTEYQDTTPDNPLVFTGTDSRLGFGETESADHNVHIDLIGIAGIYGDYEEGNNLAVTPEKKQEFFDAIQALADKINAQDSRYKIRTFFGDASKTEEKTFITNVEYGFFDGFNNTQDNERNLYTKEYKVYWYNSGEVDTGSTVGTSGYADLIGDVTKMNAVNESVEGFETATDGYLTILNGYDTVEAEKDPTLKEQPFYGAVVVTAYNPDTGENQVLYKSNYGEYGTGTDRDLNDTIIARFKRLTDDQGNLTDEWELEGTYDANGDGEYDFEKIIISNSTDMSLTIEFEGYYAGEPDGSLPEDQQSQHLIETYAAYPGDMSPYDYTDDEKVQCSPHVALMVRGWAGIYEEETKNVTEATSIADAIATSGYRQGSTKKIIFFISNQLQNTTEMTDLMDMIDAGYTAGTDWSTDNNYTELVDYLNGMGESMHFITITDGTEIIQTKYDNTTGGVISTKNYPVIKTLHTDIGQKTEFSGDNNTLNYIYGNTAYYNLALSQVEAHINATTQLTQNDAWRSLTFTAPGKYRITYWGTNTYGKKSEPAYYDITVHTDEAPIITASLADKYYRQVEQAGTQNKSATISVSGIADSTNREGYPKVESPDGDYIDWTKATLYYDKENDRILSDNIGIVLAETSEAGVTLTSSSPQLQNTGLTQLYYKLCTIR